MTEQAKFAHIRDLNPGVLTLDDKHPAKKFLSAFIDCRSICVGRELDEGFIDQDWTSATDGKRWTFSAFAYRVISFDIELDGFITNAPLLTESELSAIEQVPWYRTLMEECADAAQECGNTDCLELVGEVVNMLNRWDQYLSYRKEFVSGSDR